MNKITAALLGLAFLAGSAAMAETEDKGADAKAKAPVAGKKHEKKVHAKKEKASKKAEEKTSEKAPEKAPEAKK